MLQHRSRPIAARVLAPGLLCIALLAAGCSTQRTASNADSLEPGSSAGALLGAAPSGMPSMDEMRGNGLFHMPLEVGNRWDYKIHMRSRLVADSSPDVITETESPWRTEITGEQVMNKHEYYLQMEYDPRVAPPAAAQFALRQDRSGLYNLDMLRPAGPAAAAAETGEDLSAQFESAVFAAAANSPHREAYVAAAARVGAQLAVMGMPDRGYGNGRRPGVPGFPGGGGNGGMNRGGPLPGEISLLRYPLFMGARWVVRDSVRFSRAVVGRERATVPAGNFTAWVLRGHSELFGPKDRVYFWYARQGLVRQMMHVEMNATDAQGNVVGRVITDVDQTLTGLTLTPTVAQN